MKNKMVFIDAVARTVSEIKIDPKFIKQAYKLLRCNLVEIIPVDSDNVLIIDEEGALIEREEMFFFGGHLFHGSALLMAFEGDDEKPVAPSLSLAEVKSLVAFTTREEARPPEPSVTIIGF